MADRSVSIALVAKVAGFVAGMKVSEESVRKFGTELQKSAKHQQALRELGNAAGIMGAVAAAGFFAVVKSAATFDQAMSNVQAATHETAANMGLLRQAALDAGASTVFSATESAAAIENLSKAGVSTADILTGGLAGALDLAAAGGIEVEAAAEAAASAMTQFGLAGSEVPHIADLLAAGAGKAQGSVLDLAAALNQAGLVANQTGLTIEESTGALAAFASAGLTGSDAGTSFKTMLQSLTPRSAEAAKLMEDLNISAYDAGGNFIGLTAYAGKLQDALTGMSEQQQAATLKTIFGSDAVRAASVLYQQGAEGIQSWIDKTNDAGYASETAALRLDNLMGDLEQLKGAFETAFIGTGEGANGPLREMVQLITGLVNAYNSLPGPVKTGALALTGLTAVIGLSAFAASRAVLAYGGFKSNLSTLGITAAETNKKMLLGRAGALGLAAGLGALNSQVSDTNNELKTMLNAATGAAAGFAVGGPWGAAIGGGVGLLSGFAAESAAASARQAQLSAAGAAVTSMLDQQTGALNTATVAAAQKQLVDSGAYAVAESLGISLGLVTDAALGSAEAQAQLNEQLAEFGDSSAAAGLFAAQVGDPVNQISGDIDNFREGLEQSDVAAATMGDSLGDLGDDAAAAKEDIVTLKDAFEDLNATLSNRASARDYQAAIDDATAALKANGKTLNINTDEGRKNAAALDNLASTAIKHAQAVKEDSGSVAAQRKVIQGARGDLFDMARQFGMTAGEAKRYVNEVLKIPANAKTQLELAADKALADARAFKALLDSLHSKTILINVERHGQVEPSVASGGYITGPGTGTSDSIAARLSNGEFVIRKAAVDQIGVSNLHRMNAQGYASGGHVRQYAHSGASTGSPGDMAGIRAELAAIRRGIPVAVTNLDGFDRRSAAVASGVVSDEQAFAGTAGRMR